MSFDAGAITARITLDSTAFNASMNQARQGVAKMGQDMTGLGQKIMSTTRQLSRVASALTFLGAGITAPLVAAFKSAEKYSNSVRIEVERFSNILIKLRVSIAESLLPIMHRFSNILADLTERWQNISPAMREAMLRTTLLTGVFLILGGAIASIILKIGTLVGFIIRTLGSIITWAAATNPYLLVIGASIGYLIYMMIKYESVSTTVLNAIEIGVNMVVIGYNKLTLALVNVLKWQARLTGDFAMANWYRDQIILIEGQVKALDKNLVKILETGEGRMAEILNGARDQYNSFMSLFKDLGVKNFNVEKMLEASKTFGQGWKDQLDLTIKDLNDWGKMAGNIVTQMASTMQATLSDFFQRFLKGEIRSAKELFVSFGNFVLKIMSDVVAQIITAKLVAGIGGAISSLFGGVASGVSAGTGAISGSIGNVPVSGTIGGGAGIVTGFQEGTERIPYTGLYKLHSGEMITPRYDATKHEATKLTIYNMITSEAVAAAMSGREGEGVIINAINLNSLRNGVIRREVVKR